MAPLRATDAPVRQPASAARPRGLSEALRHIRVADRDDARHWT